MLSMQHIRISIRFLLNQNNSSMVNSHVGCFPRKHLIKMDSCLINI